RRETDDDRSLVVDLTLTLDEPAGLEPIENAGNRRRAQRQLARERSGQHRALPEPREREQLRTAQAVLRHQSAAVQVHRADDPPQRLQHLFLVAGRGSSGTVTLFSHTNYSFTNDL